VLVAVNDPSWHHVLFLVDDGAGGIFLYDYSQDAWAFWSVNLDGAMPDWIWAS
jgi:hypothetical protein